MKLQMLLWFLDAFLTKSYCDLPSHAAAGSAEETQFEDHHIVVFALHKAREILELALAGPDCRARCVQQALNFGIGLLQTPPERAQ